MHFYFVSITHIIIEQEPVVIFQISTLGPSEIVKLYQLNNDLQMFR